MGALPNKLPGGQDVEDPVSRAKFERAWGASIPTKKGMHLSQMFEAMEHGTFKALFVLGENPVQSEADQKRAIELLESLEHVVVQDMFLTKTAEIADVVLPAGASWCEDDGTVTSSERRVQRVRKALDPPGQARADLAILADLARSLGTDWGHPKAEDVWNELRALSPWHGGMSYARLEKLERPRVAVPRREPPRQPVSARPPLAGPGRGAARAVQRRRARSAGRQARRGFPDPPDDRAAARLLQHRRPDGGLHLAPAARRDARHRAGGRRAPRRRRRRGRPRRIAPRRDRGARALRRDAAPGPRVHDAPLPGRRRDEHPHDRRDRPQVRHRGIQGVSAIRIERRRRRRPDVFVAVRVVFVP